MKNYSLTHVSDPVLLRDLTEMVAHDRLTTATVLAHIAEVDARRLYVAAGYPSMFVYCVDELHMSEGEAYRRIHAARAAREFPALFAALEDGRLHLAAVSLLAPHLSRENADELILAAAHRRKSEVEELLARLCTPPELPASTRCVPATTYKRSQLIPGQVAGESARSSDMFEMAPGAVGSESAAAVGTFDELAPGQAEEAEATSPQPSPECFRFHLTITKGTRDKLRYAQGLLSHTIPSGDEAQVIDRALDALIARLERQKFAAITRGPRQHRKTLEGRAPEMRPAPGGRYVPAKVRRAVWERDQGQCTFVGARGARCKERRFLEFDHIDPVARGGRATVDRMRLRCRAHNQYEAERMFGADFMKRKRQEARVVAAESRARAAAESQARSGAVDPLCTSWNHTQQRGVLPNGNGTSNLPDP
jgi:hypothetical protein